jgi:hypothetical protein
MPSIDGHARFFAAFDCRPPSALRRQDVRQNPVMVALRFFAKLRTRTQKARIAE